MKQRLRHIVARNIFWNWTGMVVDLAAGFIVAPYLVRQLGVTGYGLWIVIGSLSGYFSLVDLGLRGSVGRHLALERAKEDWAGVNRTFSSAMAIFFVMALATLLATTIAVGVFDRVFDVPADQLANARLALFLVGVGLALSFPLQAFDGYLWAAQRFDLLNWVDIPTTLVRVGLTFALVRDRFDIVELAVITLVTGAGSGAAKAILSFRLDSQLELSKRHIQGAAGRGLLKFGWWNFVITVASLTKTQLSPVLIGSFLGIAIVTPFSIARRLLDYAQKVIWTATGVLIPVATGFHALSQRDQEQRLLVEGGKYSAAVAVFFAAYFTFAGKALISLWMGPQFAYVSTLLIILTAGTFVQMTQSVTGTIVLAAARHRAIAWLSIIETACSVALIVMVSRQYGLIGVCFALAIPQIIFTGIGTLIYGCRYTGVSTSHYLVKAIVPAVAAGIVPGVLLGWLVSWHPPASWPVLIAYSAVYGITYMASLWVVIRPPLGDRVLHDLKAALFHT